MTEEEDVIVISEISSRSWPSSGPGGPRPPKAVQLAPCLYTSAEQGKEEAIPALPAEHGASHMTAL